MRCPLCVHRENVPCQLRMYQMVTALTGIPKIHCGDDAPLSKKLLQSEPAATTGKHKHCFF